MAISLPKEKFTRMTDVIKKRDLTKVLFQKPPKPRHEAFILAVLYIREVDVRCTNMLVPD